MIHHQLVKPGMSLGRFQIVQELGVGGMGRVWKARDESLDRTVAVKVLHARHTHDQLQRMRFKREPLAMCRVNHHNVAQVILVEEMPELLYFVMEYIDGRKLSDLIADDYRMPVHDVVEVFRQIAAGLEQVHSKGIIHRDIKPGNVLVTKEGRAVLSDFGLAKVDTWSEKGSDPIDPMAALREFDAQDTLHKGLVGTPAYLAPERWLGREYDHRIDIYSFGAMIYHAVTGTPPFGLEGDHDLMMGHIKQEPGRMSELAGPVPDMLETIVERCMRKNPDRRFQTAAELHRALSFFEKDIDVSRSRVQKKLDEIPVVFEPPPESDFLQKGVRLIGALIVAALLLFTLIFLPLMAARLKIELNRGTAHGKPAAGSTNAPRNK